MKMKTDTENLSDHNHHPIELNCGKKKRKKKNTNLCRHFTVTWHKTIQWPKVIVRGTKKKYSSRSRTRIYKKNHTLDVRKRFPHTLTQLKRRSEQKKIWKLFCTHQVEKVFSGFHRICTNLDFRCFPMVIHCIVKLIKTNQQNKIKKKQQQQQSHNAKAHALRTFSILCVCVCAMHAR